MSRLQHYLNLIERLLVHCRADLSPEQWQALTERLRRTPSERAYHDEEPWTNYDYVRHYFRKLAPWQQQAFLREHRNAHRREREEVGPC